MIHRTLEKDNPGKELPSIEEIETEICTALQNTIQLAKYDYCTVLEDNLQKLSSFDGLELYRASNEYRRKAKEIRTANEALTDIDELRRTGMGKEGLKQVLAWINEEKKLKLSKKHLISELTVDDIPDEIRDFLRGIKQAMY